MNNPQYAFRIWRVVRRKSGPPTLTSATTSKTRRNHTPEEWKTKTLVARCRQRNHPAPQSDCECGIYAYPDLLDGLQLIGGYCKDSQYAFGLVSGYGGVHNDGSVIAHDACMRFAEIDIVAFAKVGSAWRTGVLSQLSAQLGVGLMSLDELVAKAATGQILSREDRRKPGGQFVDEVPIGETVSVARSALIADKTGALFLRNDREAWGKARKSKANNRMWVTARPDRTFTVSLDVSVEEPLFELQLPFAGEEELGAPNTRLAGRVTSLRATDLGREFTRHRQQLLDLISTGERVAIGPQCVDYDIEGTAWLRRVVGGGHLHGFPNYFLTRLNEREYGLEIEATDQSSLLSTSAWPFPERVGTFTHDTAATHIRLNREQVTGGRIPHEWIAHGSVYFRNAGNFQGFVV